MNKVRTAWPVRACTLLAVALSLITCAGKVDNQDEQAIALIGLAVVASDLEVRGSYRFYDGTTGTTDNGPYQLTRTARYQEFTGFAPSTGTIVHYDNARRVFVEEVTTAGNVNLGKYLWYRWHKHTDGKFYICPDLNGAADTLALSLTEFAGVETNPGTTANTANLSGGCSAFAWSRLEPK